MNKRTFKKYMETKRFFNNYIEVKETVEKTVKDLFYDQSWFDHIDDAIIEAFSRLNTNSKKHYQPMGLIKMAIFFTIIEEGLDYRIFVKDSTESFTFNLHEHEFDKIFKDCVLENYLLLKKNPKELDSSIKITKYDIMPGYRTEEQIVDTKIHINKFSFDVDFCCV